MKPIEILGLAVIVIMIALFFWLGLNMGKDMSPVVNVVDSEILPAVFECHGDIAIKMDSDNVLYFMRDGKRCLVFSNYFKGWYAENKL